MNSAPIKHRSQLLLEPTDETAGQVRGYRGRAPNDCYGIYGNNPFHRVAVYTSVAYLLSRVGGAARGVAALV